MSHSEDDDPRRQVLCDIARTLDMPVEAFLDPATFGETQIPEPEQEEELLRLFRKVRDGQARRRCLGFVRAMADRMSGE